MAPRSGRTPIKEKKVRKPSRMNKSMKSGLTFPVGRIHRMLKNRKDKPRVSMKAAVYMAAALEYLTAEMLELAGNVAFEGGRRRIKPSHICIAIKRDNELQNLLQRVIVAHGGVVPYIEPFILDRLSKTK